MFVLFKKGKMLRYVLDLVAFGCQYSVRCRPADSGCKKQTRCIAMQKLPTLPSEIKVLAMRCRNTVKEASNTFPPSVTIRVTVVDVGRRRILVGNGI